MADAIIKFPGAAVKSSSGIGNAEMNAISKIMEQAPPDGADSYPCMPVLSVPERLKTRPDFASAKDRNPHWGMIASFSIIPDLSKAPVGSIMLPTSPSQFFAADTLEDLKKRVLFEVEKAFSLAQIATDNPEAYEQYERLMLADMAKRMHGADASE